MDNTDMLFDYEDDDSTEHSVPVVEDSTDGARTVMPSAVVVVTMPTRTPSRPVGKALERYQAEYVEPVTKLNGTLSDVLDVDSNTDRTPEEALTTLKSAIQEFQSETSNWR